MIHVRRLMSDAHNSSAQTVMARRPAAPYLRPAGDGPALQLETMTVKLLLSVAALAGSLTILVSTLSQNALAYL